MSDDVRVTQSRSVRVKERRELAPIVEAYTRLGPRAPGHQPRTEKALEVEDAVEVSLTQLSRDSEMAESPGNVTSVGNAVDPGGSIRTDDLVEGWMSFDQMDESLIDQP